MKYRLAGSPDSIALKHVAIISYGQYKAVIEERYWEEMDSNHSDQNTYDGLLEIAKGFVCEIDREIVGMTFLVPSGNPTSIFQADWAYIRLLGVLPEFENRGIGRELMRLCIDKARASGETTLALHTSEIQNAARHLYESMGFVRHKDIDLIYGKKYFLYLLQPIG